VKTFTPPSKSPTEQWVFSCAKKANYIYPPTKWVKRVTITNNQNETPNLKKKEASDSKKFAYNNNYKGRNPITKAQWRRFQRLRKVDALKDVTNTDKGKNKQTATFQMFRKPTTERIFPPLSVVKENLPVEDEKLTLTFSESEASFDVICVASILSIEYDVTSEIIEDEDDFTEEMVVHKPMCYYVMNNGYVEDHHAIFERHDYHMKSHLKPLFIQAKIKYIGVNKVLEDGGAVVNLLPQSLLKRIGISESDLKPHNVFLSNYEGKFGSSFGDVEVDLVVGNLKRATLFLVVALKANYNLLLGREWIHGVGVVPSTMHQRVTL